MRPPGVYSMWDDEDSGVSVHMKLSADALYDSNEYKFPSSTSYHYNKVSIDHKKLKKKKEIIVSP